MLRSRFENCWNRTILDYTRWRRRTRRNEEFMSRIHVTSNWKTISTERVDYRKYEDRPGSGREGLRSSKTLRYWNHDQISFSWQNDFLGSNCERNWQIRFRNVRNRWPWHLWAQRSDGETCCEGQTTSKAFCDIVSCLHSYSCQKMDRHWNATIRSKVLCSIKSHDQITATSSIRSSTRLWWSTFWRYYERIWGKVRWLLAMVSSWLDNFAWQKEENTRKRFQYCLNTHSSKLFLYFRETISMILHCKTIYCCRRTSPSTSSTSEV